MTDLAAAQALIRQGASMRSGIASFIVMDVMRAAAAREAAGHRVIHMEVGQPGTSAPKAAREAVKRALDTDSLGYTLALGMPELRRRIAGLYRTWYGLDLDPARVVVTSGSSAAFVLGFLAAFDVGARIGLPSPGYPCYRHVASALGMTPVVLETTAATRWMPTLEQVEAAVERERLAGLLIASPANPTGTMLEPARLSAIARACAARGVWFISDEIYHGLSHGMPCHSALQYSDDAIVINSFSKYFSMTGWRVGWMVLPERLIGPAERLAQNLYISAPAVAQVAAIGAFDAIDELEANKAVYRANREVLLAGLPAAGLDQLVPADGAFYIYADISRFTNDSLGFCRQLLEDTGIAATPGVDFDEARGHRFMRFSYAGTTADMQEAVALLRGWERLRA
jgi:aspartate/methionine/tyrosine aminotransferase